MADTAERLEETLASTRDSVVELNDALELLETPGERQPDLRDSEVMKDLESKSDSSTLPDKGDMEALKIDDRTRAKLLAAVDKFAASDFDAVLPDAGAPDRNRAKCEMVAAIDKLARSDFDAGGNKNLYENSVEDSHTESSRSGRGRGNRGNG